MTPPDRIPAIVNRDAGAADDALAALAASDRFDVHAVNGVDVPAMVRGIIEQGARRVLVAGGDGTLASAAALVAGTPTELALLPVGTLNHFAKAHEIPLEPAAAIAVAGDGAVRPVDVAMVNEHVFLNTSSVGAYVPFVRRREIFERRLGYVLATLLASIAMLRRVRAFRVVLELEGARRVYWTPLVFIGVGERELKLPRAGAPRADGRRGLHVIVPREHTVGGLLRLAFQALIHGVDAAVASMALESILVEHCVIGMRRPRGNVALDGEIVPMRAPLVYRYVVDGLRIVVPRETSAT